MVFSGMTLYHLFFNQTKMKNIYSRIDNPSPSFFLAKREGKRGEILSHQGRGKRSKALSPTERKDAPPLFTQTMDVKSAK
jgi:hypothetical protein